MVDGIPCRKHQPVPTSDTIVVSVLPEALHQQVLSIYHDSPAIGHQGTAGGVLGEHGPMYHMTEVQLPMLERTLLPIFNITFRSLSTKVCNRLFISEQHQNIIYNHAENTSIHHHHSF